MFAERFKELRLERGINQKDLGDILKTSTSTIGMWEQGRRSPDKEMLVKIADYFKVSTDYLLGRTEYRDYLRISDFEDLDEDTQEKIFIRMREFTQNPKEKDTIRVQLSNRMLCLTLKDLTALISYMDSIGISIDIMLENSLKYNPNNKEISD